MESNHSFPTETISSRQRKQLFQLVEKEQEK